MTLIEGKSCVHFPILVSLAVLDGGIYVPPADMQNTKVLRSYLSADNEKSMWV